MTLISTAVYVSHTTYSSDINQYSSDNNQYSSRGVTIGGAAGAAADGPVSLGVLLQTWGTGL